MFKVFEFIAEVFGWIKIVLSPLLMGFFIGLVIYSSHQSNTGLVLGITINLIGLIVGIVWATRIWKKQGTNNFLSRIYSTPELDSAEDEDLKK